jgi:hypothetical protein
VISTDVQPIRARCRTVKQHRQELCGEDQTTSLLAGGVSALAYLIRGDFGWSYGELEGLISAEFMQDI